MRQIAALCALWAAAITLGATAKDQPKKIGGEEVIGGPVFSAKPIVDVSGLRFGACKLKRNEADCTVITGTLVSHLPHQNYVVTIDIDFYEVYASASEVGTARIEVDRPVPGKLVRFEGLGPGWHGAQARGEDKRPVWAGYTLRTSIKLYKPPKPEDPKRE